MAIRTENINPALRTNIEIIKFVVSGKYLSEKMFSDFSSRFSFLNSTAQDCNFAQFPLRFLLIKSVTSIIGITFVKKKFEIFF